MSGKKSRRRQPPPTDTPIEQPERSADRNPVVSSQSNDRQLTAKKNTQQTGRGEGTTRENIAGGKAPDEDGSSKRKSPIESSTIGVKRPKSRPNSPTPVRDAKESSAATRFKSNRRSSSTEGMSESQSRKASTEQLGIPSSSTSPIAELGTNSRSSRRRRSRSRRRGRGLESKDVPAISTANPAEERELAAAAAVASDAADMIEERSLPSVSVPLVPKESKPSVEEEDDEEDDEEEEEDEEEDDEEEEENPAALLSSLLQQFSGNARTSGSGGGGGVSSRLRSMLSGLRSLDPSEQFMALQDLNELLAMSTEENLGASSGASFDSEEFVGELKKVLSGENNPLGVDNPEIQLLACRCLSNLLEALPTHSTFAAISRTGLVGALSMKLMNIEYIDVAEQAVQLLEQISREHTKDILKEGGMQALLGFLDFFHINVQRKAIECVANSLQQVPREYFGQCAEVMPRLSDLLQSHDQKIVEMACLAAGRAVESAVRLAARVDTTASVKIPELDELVSDALLRNWTNLLLAAVGDNPNGLIVVSDATITAVIRIFRLIAENSPDQRCRLVTSDVGRTLTALILGASSDDLSVSDLTEADFSSVSEKQYLIPILDLFVSLLPGTVLDQRLKDGRDLLAPYKLSFTKNEDEVIFDFPLDNNAAPSHVETTLNRGPLVSFCQQVLSITVPTFLDSVNADVRMKCMITIYRAISILEGDELREVLVKIPLSNFLARVLGRYIPTMVSQSPPQELSESRLLLDMPPIAVSRNGNSSSSLAMLTYVIDITRKLTEKLAEVFAVTLKREGVVSELEQFVIDAVVSEPVTALQLIQLRQDYAHVRVLLNERKREESQGALSRFQSAIAQTVGTVFTESNGIPTRASTAARQSQSRESDSGQTHSSEKSTTANIVGRGWKGSSGVERSVSRSRENRSRTSDQETRGLRALLKLDDASPAVLAKHLLNLGSRYQQQVEAWYMQQLAHHADLFLKKYPVVKNAPGLQISQGLVAAVAALKSSQNQVDTLQKFFSEAVVTNSELLASGFIPAIVSWLAGDQKVPEKPGERARAFMNTFFVQVGEFIPAENLLRHLMDLLAQLEFFAAVTPLTQDLLPAGTGLMPSRSPNSLLLAKQLRIRLEPDESVLEKMGGEKPGMKMVLSVHSVAEFRTIEEYVLSKLDPLRALNSLPSEQEASISMEMEMGRVRHDSSYVHDVSRSSSEKPSSPVTNPKRDYGIEFKIGEMSIPSDMTIYGAIHRFETECRARSLSGIFIERDGIVQTPFQSPQNTINVFPNIYTLKYHLRAPEEVQSKARDFAPLASFVKTMDPLMRPCADRNIPADGKSFQSLEEEDDLLKLPPSLEPHRTKDCVQVLLLLRLLFQMNQKTLENANVSIHQAISISKFRHRKLIGKIERLLADVFITANDLLPAWAMDLAHSFPFLFPYELRLRLLQCAYFGSARVLMKWKQQESPDNAGGSSGQRSGITSLLQLLNGDIGNLGRISRQKVRISRDRMWESAVKILDVYARNNRYLMEVEFFEECGSGLGPTLEFYAVVSSEWRRPDLNMWRSTNSPLGLYPMSAKVTTSAVPLVKKRFGLLGQFIAKSMFDFRLVDIPLNRLFLKQVFHGSSLLDQQTAGPERYVRHGLKQLAIVDPELAQSLSSLCNETDATVVEAMCLDFTLPGYDTIELVSGGAHRRVTRESVLEYVGLVVDAIVGSGVHEYVKAFQNGFNHVFPVTSLQLLDVKEVESLLSSGVWEGKWERQAILDAIKVDHGFTKESRAIQYLVDVLTQFDQQEQRLFVQFITGAPKLPIGGFRALIPPLTIVCKTSDMPDSYLPSVMTCVNYLKLPQYSSADVLHKRLMFAMQEGQGSFHLS